MHQKVYGENWKVSIFLRKNLVVGVGLGGAERPFFVMHGLWVTYVKMGGGGMSFKLDCLFPLS